MRSLRLARIAAEAEAVRLRLHMQRVVTRLMLGTIALAFLAIAVAFVHVAAWYWLRLRWDEQSAALAMAGGDAVIAVFLALLAARSTPGRTEQEALAVRQRALDSAKNSVAISAIAMQVLRLLTNFISRGRRS